MSAQDEPDKLSRPDQSSSSGVPDRSVQGFEAELASLSPRAVHLDRDRLMFLAGQASVSGLAMPEKRGWAWPAAFSGMSALAAGLLVTLVLRSQPREVVKIVQVPANVQTGGDTPAEPPNERVLSSSERVAVPGGPSRPEVTAQVATGKAAQGRPYVELRDRVLAMGLDGWPSDVGRPREAGNTEDPRPQSPAAYHELLDSLLHGG